MKIGGFQPVTLLDYPQKVAAIIFASGCNMRCPFCYNPNLVLPELIGRNSLMPEDYIFEYLAKRKKYLDGVVLTGGEPTMQADIAEFLEKIKKISYSVKLDTNGLLPNVLKKLIEAGLVDYLAMDVKAPINRYLEICGQAVNTNAILKSIEIVKLSGLPYEFRSTLVKGFHREEDVLAMARLISGANKYFLQNFVSKEKLVAAEFKGRQFLPSEMEEFRDLASRFVEKCLIR